MPTVRVANATLSEACSFMTLSSCGYGIQTPKP